MRQASGRLALLLAAAIALAAPAARVQAAKTLADLQTGRRGQSIAVGTSARATLVDLNPAVGAWFVLTIEDARGAATFHLESADPGRQRLRLDAAGGGALEITTDGAASRCTPWAGPAPDALERARRSALPFAPLCDGRLFVRNPVPGNRTTLEATTEFLRDHVWGGERIIGFVRREFYRDAFVERAASSPPAAPAAESPAGAPAPARVRPEASGRSFVPTGLGLDVPGAREGLLPGRWAAVRGIDGVYLSAIAPADLAETPPDQVEASAVAFLVAFDLARLDLGFTLGTEHPRLGWSARVPDAARDAALPGPDGVASAAPLVRTGMLSPALAARAVATFTGGFKREHGAFRYGALAQRRHGSHYGFVEQGVVFSTLQPGLATLFVTTDGTVGMNTWTDADDARLARVRDARQNGVPLLERDPAGGPALIGPLVGQWGAGNWSGSADEKLRTLRAGACLVEHGRAHHLLYGYFSAATPVTMARVFRAYGCAYAMHLDMNALEHTYLALYAREGQRTAVQHLVPGMAQLDRSVRGALVPRFIGVPDDRDFFFLVRKEPAR